MTNGFLADANITELDTSTVAPLAEETHTENPNNDNKENPSNATNTTNWEKRYADQQRYVTKLQNELKTKDQAIEELKRKPLELPKTKEQLDEYKKQYPDLVDTIVSLARLEVTEQSKQLDEERKAVLQKLADIESEKLILAVAKVHKDALQIRNDPKFHNWLSEQSPAVKSLFESSDAKDPIKGLNLYKEDMGIKTPRVQREDSATAVSATSQPDIPEGNKKVWKQSEVARLTDAQYQKHRKDIHDAMNTKGRYIKDLTP